MAINTNKKRVLVPGDAKVLGLSHAPNDSHLLYQFEVKWQEWSFEKHWPFIHSSPNQEQWSIEVPINLDLLSTDEVGYTVTSSK